VITDFDGTIVTKDLSLLVLERFGLPGWREYDQRLEMGEMSIEPSLRAQYGMVRAGSKTEVLRYARRHSKLRDGFADLSRACGARGVALVVVSAGLDFCIEDALRKFRLKVDRLVCPRSKFTPNGIEVAFPPARPDSRNFKESVVADFAARGVRSVYAGDGYSDFYPASRADKVFAVADSVLARECMKNGVRFTPFTNFRQMLGVVS
jgi:HAD superfamily phosphoserine phosphatase-like hydrolase